MPRAARLLAVLLLGLPACAPRAPPSIRIAWRFADGRRCPDTGAQRVLLRAEEDDPLACAVAGCIFACPDGEADSGASVEIGLPDGARDDLAIDLRAESPMGTLLYRGATTPAMREPDAGLAVALLRFVGGE